jgi:cation diffusion facilitator family transporter
MAAEDNTRAVITALAANLGIAVSKFVAAAVTGSSSMLAEGVHSMADSANQALLLIGGRRARRQASALHPFGYARERYIYAFIVSIVLFSLGGLYALYEGYQKLLHPPRLTSPIVAVVVLVIAIGLEGYALRTAAVQANRGRGDLSWWQYIHRARAPELPVILLEDAGAVTGLLLALAGVGLTLITNNGAFDAAATVAIGVLLVAIAVLLGRETKSLLIGESATKDDLKKIHHALLTEPGIDNVLDLRTMHLGPDELLVTGRIAVGPRDDADEISHTIDAATGRLRHAVPSAKIVYLEPDVTNHANARPS